MEDYDYLQHHGIKGQKWGKKNGPPYPLGYDAHTKEQKAKNPKSVIDPDAPKGKKNWKKAAAIVLGTAAVAAGAYFVYDSIQNRKMTVSLSEMIDDATIQNGSDFVKEHHENAITDEPAPKIFPDGNSNNLSEYMDSLFKQVDSTEGTPDLLGNFSESEDISSELKEDIESVIEKQADKPVGGIADTIAAIDKDIDELMAKLDAEDKASKSTTSSDLKAMAIKKTDDEIFQGIKSFNDYSSETYKRFTHEKLDGEDFWNNELSEAERQGIIKYTGSSYIVMNNYLRGIKGYESISPQLKTAIDNATSGLNKHTAKESFVAHRGVKYGAVAKALGIDQLGIDFNNPSSIDPNVLLSLKGHQYSDPGFTSTSVPNSHFSGLKFHVEVPKGTKGLYVEDHSHYSGIGEEEWLMPPGTSFEIVDWNIALNQDGTVKAVTDIFVKVKDQL